VRVLLASHRFPPDSVAGVERITQSLAAELVNAGDTVSIVTRRPAANSAGLNTLRERLRDGTVVHRLVGGEVRLDRPLLHHERLEQLFTRALLEAEPHVVHILHLFGLSPGFIGIARRLRVPVVLELQDFYFACPLVHLQKPSGELCAGPDAGRECARTCFRNGDASTTLRWGLRAAYFRRFLDLAAHVICPSRHVASYFERLGADPARLYVLPNGVAIEAADPNEEVYRPPVKRGKLNLAFLGTVVAHKGVHVILDALSIAGLGSVDLVVLGHLADRQYADGLRTRAAAIPGLRLRLWGAYEPSDLPVLLRDVDCVITPSLVPEAGPISPREALTRGVPVIATRLGALPEVVIDGQNGVTFDHARPSDLAVILQQLASDENLLPRLREGAQASRLPTVSERAAAVRALYADAIERVRNSAVPRADLAEIDFLHEALLDTGCGGPGATATARSHLAVARA
jgi:glycosyltransferase involved in cell wall biosynthesis